VVRILLEVAFHGMAFFVISNHVGMRFGRNVLHVNTRCLTELDFCFDVIISRWRP